MKVAPAAWITGASGFIGGHLVERLKQAGWRVAEVSYRGGPSEWPAADDVVFHLGGVAHRHTGAATLTAANRELAVDLYRHAGAATLTAANRELAVDLYRHAGAATLMAANCELTVELYRRAQRAGCRGFVFVSTAKVLGDAGEAPFTPAAPRRPMGVYAESKALAEERLLALHERGGPPLAIVRPPLVYGAGAKANFKMLARAVATGLPLPFAGATGPRSFVSVANLVDALANIGTALHNQDAARLWHVADGEDIDVATLCRRLGAKLGRPARLWPLPRSVFDAVARLSGGYGISSGLVASLFQPFQLDDSALREELGWSPPQTLDAALQDVADWLSRQRQASGAS